MARRASITVTTVSDHSVPSMSPMSAQCGLTTPLLSSPLAENAYIRVTIVPDEGSSIGRPHIHSIIRVALFLAGLVP